MARSPSGSGPGGFETASSDVPSPLPRKIDASGASRARRCESSVAASGSQRVAGIRRVGAATPRATHVRLESLAAFFERLDHRASLFGAVEAVRQAGTREARPVGIETRTKRGLGRIDDAPATATGPTIIAVRPEIAEVEVRPRPPVVAVRVAGKPAGVRAPRPFGIVISATGPKAHGEAHEETTRNRESRAHISPLLRAPGARTERLALAIINATAVHFFATPTISKVRKAPFVTRGHVRDAMTSCHVTVSARHGHGSR